MRSLFANALNNTTDPSILEKKAYFETLTGAVSRLKVVSFSELDYVLSCLCRFVRRRKGLHSIQRFEDFQLA